MIKKSQIICNIFLFIFSIDVPSPDKLSNDNQIQMEKKSIYKENEDNKDLYLNENILNNQKVQDLLQGKIHY